MWPFKSKIKLPETKERVKDDITQHLNQDVKGKFLTTFKSISQKKYNSNSLLSLAENVSQVNSLINYIATKGMDIPIKHVRYSNTGKIKDLGETEVLKAVQDIKIDNIIQQFIIHGNSYILKKKTPGFQAPTSFDILNSPSIFAIPQNSIDIYGTPSLSIANYDNPIVKFKQELEDRSLKTLNIEDVIWIKDSNPKRSGKDFYYGASRLYAATQSLNVLKNLYETINTILSAKGALGFISRSTKTGELDPMMWQDIISDLENKLNYEYGTTDGRKAIMATFADTKWNRMDSPVNEFIPVELTAQEFSQLCNQMGGIPDILFNSKGNTTYNNYETALKVFYTNVLQPILSIIYNTISIDLGLTKVGEWIIPDYSEIECLKPDEKTENEAKQIEYEYYTQLYNDNLITLNQYLIEIDQPTRADGNLYKSEIPTKAIPLAVSIGVGGITSLQAILADVNISDESKVNILQILFGISESDAKRMVIKNTTNGSTVQSQAVAG